MRFQVDSSTHTYIQLLVSNIELALISKYNQYSNPHEKLISNFMN